MGIISLIACSIVLINESLSAHLRCLTSIQLFENAKYYANHPLIESQHKNVAFTSPKNAFAMCVSDAALTFFKNSNEIAAVLEEAKETAKNYTFSFMVCMFALSTVIQCVIQSYYLFTNDTVAKENWDSLDSIVQYIHGIILMAVQLNMSISFIVPPSYLVDRRIPSTKNNFVTLCKPVKALYFKAHLPTLLKSAMPVHPKVPPTVFPKASTKVSSAPSSTRVTTSTKKQTTGTKRKQISFDALLVKRACNTQETVDSEIKCPSTSKGISSVTPNTGPTSEKSNTKTQRTSTNLWPDDIYNYVNLVSSLPVSKKYEILCNHWKPGSDFSFPPHKNIGRRFRFPWLSRFPWLAYSAVANGGFSVTCVLFGSESTHNASKLQRLMTSALPPSASAVQKLCQHGEKSNAHATATLHATQFKQMIENKTLGIDVQLKKTTL
jgi:hypothetical protein